jgi:hypothetical protein
MIWACLIKRGRSKAMTLHWAGSGGAGVGKNLILMVWPSYKKEMEVLARKAGAR